MSWFTGAESPEELIALSWMLEDGLGRFYKGVSVQLKEADADASVLFSSLVSAEDSHKTRLENLLKGRHSGTLPEGFPVSVLNVTPHEDIMEGGVNVTEALKWTEGKNPVEALELSVALETNAYDLYIKMSRIFDDSESKDVFDTLSREEKAHLEMLAGEYEERISD